MNSMLDLIRKLSPLRMAPNSAGLDQCVEYLCQELPFEVMQVEAGESVNGWIVPQKWEVHEATIKSKSGELFYNGLDHPLGVIGYSQPFVGEVTGKVLKQHCYFSEVFDDALIYHCDLFYKPFKKEWGFSVTKQLYDQIMDDQLYQIDVKTSFEKGTMKIAEYTLPGESEECILINGHNCHAFCCNDDLSGCAVGIEVMRRLSQQKERRYTYRLVIAPEHYGSIFYLDRQSPEVVDQIKSALFIESVGAGSSLILQRSFTGTSLIDRALQHALTSRVADARSAPFRTVVGNDETCWDAVGYEIPCPSLSRCEGPGLFPEYHTSKDSPDLMDGAMLDEAVAVVLDALMIMENDCTMRSDKRGLVALSHPDYDLYFPAPDPSKHDRETIDDLGLKWNYMMDCLPRYFNSDIRLLEVAERHQIPFQQLYDYIQAFADKDLVQIESAGLSPPPIRAIPPV